MKFRIPGTLLTVFALLLSGCAMGSSSPAGQVTLYALNLDFESSAGGMTIAKGTANAGNGTLSAVSGSNGLQINANTADQYGSIGAEIQFELVNSAGEPAFVDMSSEEWIVKFRYYLPSGGTVPQGVQFGIYENREYKVIYSTIADCSVTDTWTEITIPVDTAHVGYSAFDNDPADWSLNLLRLQFIGSAAGQTIVIYLDDLRVYTDNGVEEEPEPYNPYITYSGLNGTAKNPIISHIFTADPSAKVFDGRVYIYTSHDLDTQTSYNMKDYHVFSSDDLVNWQDHGVIIHANDVDWANSLYAPDCVKSPVNGKYYLYYPDSGSGVGVAVSDTPDGPFVDALGEPLVDSSTPGAEDVDWIFDPMCFVDDDGEVYLYFGGGMPDTGDNARVIRLNSDMISLKDAEATVIAAPDYFEAPFMHERDGVYYFSYSTNFADHAAAIDYMTSDNPMTGFTYRGTILPNPPGNNSDNNHHSIFELDRSWYIVYHNRKLANRDGYSNYQRSITLDELTYNLDGTIVQVTPTDGSVAQLKNLDPFTTIEAEMIADQRGIETADMTTGTAPLGVYVTDISDKEWIGYSRLDFGTGATGFRARIATDYNGGGVIDIYIDGCDLFTDRPGTLIGSCTVNTTGGQETWVEESCAITETTGIKDVYLRFRGTEGETLFNLDSFVFE
jgi:arabinoxylan arabinofuranohydrolase